MTTAPRVLLVDDEPDLQQLLVWNLEQAGFAVEAASTGNEAIAAAARERPAVVVLDVMLPDIPGTEVCRQLRADPRLEDVGILMLTARGDEADRVVGFEVGADDYVVKPFSMKELLSRIQVFLRRNKLLIKPAAKQFTIGSFSFTPEELRLVHASGSTTLTQREAELLTFLCEHPNRILKREEILLHVWGKNDFFLGRSMDVFITRLRKFLAADPSVSIETIHKVGYRFVLKGQE